MGVLADGSITIADAMDYIEGGKFVMPAFQRQFVWNTSQIEKLWDSILLDYPISTFLFWEIDEGNTDEKTYFCEFMESVAFDFQGGSNSSNYELITPNLAISDTAILDGQQRLTSLYLSLIGETFAMEKYARRKSGSKIATKLVIELDKNKLDLDPDVYNSMKHDIRFNKKVMRISPTQFEIRKVMQREFKNKETRDEAVESAIKRIPNPSKDYARELLTKLCEKVHDEPLIRFTLIKGMKQDDALEMFVRFNSGGKNLSKSDITMSILEAYWPSARTEFGQVLQGGYSGYGTDFIVRSALMLFGDVVKSNINHSVVKDLKDNWSDFKETLSKLESLLGKLHIRVDRFKSSWNVLLPIIYYIFQSPGQYMENEKDIEAYLTRAILFRYFQSGTTGKLQQMRTNIINYDFEITIDMLDQMSELRVTQARIDDILDSEKGSRIAGEALYLLNRGWMKTGLHYEQDHLHPDVRFMESKPSGVTKEQWSEWRSWRNRLANLQYLEGRSNGSKNDMPLIEYYNDMNEDQQRLFRKEALIPDGCSLEISDFGRFYQERRNLIRERILEMLS